MPDVGMVPPSRPRLLHGGLRRRVFAFGDAHFAGSCPGIGGCAGRAVAVDADRHGKGYWLVTMSALSTPSGDATFYGSAIGAIGGRRRRVATPDWRGYWLLYANGAVAPSGCRRMEPPLGLRQRVQSGHVHLPDCRRQGLLVASGRGDVFAYGNAPYLGSEAAAGLNGEIIAAFGF